MPNNVTAGTTPVTVNVIFQLFSAGSSAALAQSGLGSSDLDLGSSGLGGSEALSSLGGSLG